MRARFLLSITVASGCTFEHDLHSDAVETTAPDAATQPGSTSQPGGTPTPPPTWSGAEQITTTDTSAALAINSSSIYWLEQTGALRSISKATGSVTEIAPAEPDISGGQLLADDDGLAYVIGTPLARQVWVSDPDGAHSRVTMSVVDEAALAMRESELYISTGRTVVRARRTGASVQTVVNASYHLGDVTIDGDTLYSRRGGAPVSNENPFGQCVVRMPIAGGSPEDVFCGLVFTRPLLVMNGALIGSVYHSGQPNSVEKIEVSSGATKKLLSLGGDTQPAIAVHGNFLYASVLVSGLPPYPTMIQCVPLAGGLARTIANGPGMVHGLSVDNSGVYFIAAGEYENSIRRADLCQ